jgi:hypothetical protein
MVILYLMIDRDEELAAEQSSIRSLQNLKSGEGAGEGI